MNETLNRAEQLNRVWRENRFDELRDFSDPDIVIKGSGFNELTRGREALVKSYADFMAQPKIFDYVESDHAALVGVTPLPSHTIGLRP